MKNTHIFYPIFLSKDYSSEIEQDLKAWHTKFSHKLSIELDRKSYSIKIVASMRY